MTMDNFPLRIIPSDRVVYHLPIVSHAYQLEHLSKTSVPVAMAKSMVRIQQSEMTPPLSKISIP